MAGFYRTCVIDQVIAASPADYVRRPNVPAEPPTLGLSHLQFEALLSASRLSVNVNDFALVVMLGLLFTQHIQRTYNSTWARLAPRGSTPRSRHHTRKLRRSDSVWTRVCPR